MLIYSWEEEPVIDHAIVHIVTTAKEPGRYGEEVKVNCDKVVLYIPTALISGDESLCENCLSKHHQLESDKTLKAFGTKVPMVVSTKS
jgi:hypothetical protein